MAENREDLIYSLARSMGMGDAQKTKYSVSNYNSETGTLVCNGHIISRNNIDRAKSYFSSQYHKLMEKDDEGARQLAMMYEVAVEAIGFMLQTNVKNPDGIVAKDKDKE
ncbi:MAG: hypothetical protein IJT34_08535 [Butyrivibrio sp.]|nr:hypothetical protein [Butyrivibrio sp.]